jgi:PPK2 family polyphosphate:nucleotide phosphotransferase
MEQLQYLMYAERKHSLLIVLQGLDAAGKDGVVRHVLTGMNPAGCTSVNFKQPTAEELAHDFLWRVNPHLPGKGLVAIFNRSHYEDVLVVRVHELVPEQVWSKRYDEINEFEKLIAIQNNTTILKFFLHISKQEQLARFAKRLDDPARQWKISESDYKEREYWGDSRRFAASTTRRQIRTNRAGRSENEHHNGFCLWGGYRQSMNPRHRNGSRCCWKSRR